MTSELRVRPDRPNKATSAKWRIRRHQHHFTRRVCPHRVVCAGNFPAKYEKNMLTEPASLTRKQQQQCPHLTRLHTFNARPTSQSLSSAAEPNSGPTARSPIALPLWLRHALGTYAPYLSDDLPDADIYCTARRRRHRRTNVDRHRAVTTRPDFRFFSSRFKYIHRCTHSL